jgi:hypothetical protein
MRRLGGVSGSEGGAMMNILPGIKSSRLAVFQNDLKMLIVLARDKVDYLSTC